MPKYNYKALTKSGEDISGEYSAKSRDEVVAMIRSNGYYPVSIEEHKGAKEIDILAFKQKIKLKDLAIFCRQFFTMMNAGVTLINCLEILKEQTANKKFKEAIGDVYDDVNKGRTFAEALKNKKEVFPELLINMVEAGEVSGTLDVIMERMAIHFEKENKLNSKVRAAMVYPAFLSALSILVVFFLITFIMPTFVGMFEGSGVPLPGPTRFVMGISDILKQYWYLVFALIGLLTYGVKAYAKSEDGSLLLDQIKMKIPVVKTLSINVAVARFTRTLSTLMSSGVSLIESIEIATKVVGNKVVVNGLSGSRENLGKGLSLAEIIKKAKVFPKMVESMIEIGEESGSLDDILNRTAEFYDSEVETSVEIFTKLIEPVMLIVMAFVVGFIVIAMVLPMFEMMNTIAI